MGVTNVQITRVDIGNDFTFIGDQIRVRLIKDILSVDSGGLKGILRQRRYAI